MPSAEFIVRDAASGRKSRHEERNVMNSPNFPFAIFLFRFHRKAQPDDDIDFTEPFSRFKINSRLPMLYYSIAQLPDSFESVDTTY